MRNLVLLPGDQLTLSSPALEGFDAALDSVWMAEVREESEHVPSTKMRSALFLSAMRHFRALLESRGVPVQYLQLGEHRFESLKDALREAIGQHRPAALVMAEAGEWRIESLVEEVCRSANVRLEVREDTHFMASRADFAQHVRGKQRLRMETFYRQMRLRYKVMLEPDDQPQGGQWNFDHDNRGAFGRAGPGLLPRAPSFEPDEITRQVMKDVEAHFGSHYGSLDAFDWPVTREDALVMLNDFVEHRLQDFGRFQDAMWTDEMALYHGLLSSSLNLRLLDPREVIEAAVDRLRRRLAPIEAVEGFVRQILGWREFMRGVYWWRMPELSRVNHLDHHAALPDWYWTGDVAMNCMKQVIGQTLRTGYAHHIQRLMVTGNFAMTFGVEPQQVHAWYLSVYVDAVEWVELPNTVGMSQYADGDRFTSKPYAAGGAYVNRMSNYCGGCRYKPGVRSGEGACPMTVMYWDFVARHEQMLDANPRTNMMSRNLQRFGADDVAAIRRTADEMRKHPERL